MPSFSMFWSYSNSSMIHHSVSCVSMINVFKCCRSLQNQLSPSWAHGSYTLDEVHFIGLTTLRWKVGYSLAIELDNSFVSFYKIQTYVDSFFFLRSRPPLTPLMNVTAASSTALSSVDSFSFFWISFTASRSPSNGHVLRW